jgi:hypothetical protein
MRRVLVALMRSMVLLRGPERRKALRRIRGRKEEEECHNVGRKSGKKKNPDWMTNGTPPPLEQRTMELIDQLSHLDLNDGLQSLITLVNRLILPVTASEHPLYSLAPSLLIVINGSLMLFLRISTI